MPALQSDPTVNAQIIELLNDNNLILILYPIYIYFTLFLSILFFSLLHKKIRDLKENDNYKYIYNFSMFIDLLVIYLINLYIKNDLSNDLIIPFLFVVITAIFCGKLVVDAILFILYLYRSKNFDNRILVKISNKLQLCRLEFRCKHKNFYYLTYITYITDICIVLYYMFITIPMHFVKIPLLLIISFFRKLHIRILTNRRQELFSDLDRFDILLVKYDPKKLIYDKGMLSSEKKLLENKFKSTYHNACNMKKNTEITIDKLDTKINYSDTKYKSFNKNVLLPYYSLFNTIVKAHFDIKTQLEIAKDTYFRQILNLYIVILFIFIYQLFKLSLLL